MAGSLNKVMLIGNLGSDPEVRYTPSGRAVANFNIATSETWNDQSGQRQERTEWHRIVAWGKLAELCGEYLGKGRQIYVEGKLQTRQWDDREGNKRYTTELQARDIRFLGSRNDAQAGAGNVGANRGYDESSTQNSGGDAGNAGGTANFSTTNGGGNDYGPPPITDDDIPF